jgi:hypothetical protein
MDSLVSGEQIQAVSYQLAPLSPKGLGFAVDAIGIALAIIGIIAISLRLYARLGFSVGLSRSLGPDDVLAILGTVSCPLSTAGVPAEAKGSRSSVSAMLTIECQPAHIRRCGCVRCLCHPLRSRHTRPGPFFTTLPDSSCRIHSVLGSFVSFLVQHDQVCYRIHLHATGCTKTVCHPNVYQHVRYGSC